MGEDSFPNCIDVALGREEADLVIKNAKLINVYTGEILTDQTITVKGNWISSVGQLPSDQTIGHKTKVIDALGKTLIPGLIDGHTHIFGQYFEPIDFLKHVIPSGTTTLVTETLEPVFISGKEGFFDLIKVLTDQPIKIFFLAPPLLSISPNIYPLDQNSALEMLRHKDVLGLGESYWQLVLSNQDELKPLMQEALQLGKRLEGHSAGARKQKLNAYLSTGISSCHEPISVEEVVERLRLGIHVMIREGSIRSDLEMIAPIKDFKDIDLRRLILVTDSVTPHDLLEKGAMEYLVQKAIDLGFDPVTAIRMATLNPAEHFGIDSTLGGIAPGKQADMVIIPEPENIQAEYVISQGVVIAEQGKALKYPRQDQISEVYRKTVKLPSKGFQSSDFSIKTLTRQEDLQVRVIDQITDLVTKEKIMSMPVKHGQINIDIDRDIIKVAAIDRVINPGQISLGLIHGIGLKEGAFASSATWDSTDIIVIGADESDMAQAVNRVCGLQGGIVVCSKGQIRAELPLPYFGLLPDIQAKDVVTKLDEIKEHLRQLGADLQQPCLTLNVLTTAAIPFYRICEQGLIDFKDQITRDVFTDT